MFFGLAQAMTIQFYATISYGEIRPYMPNTHYLFPASSWAKNGGIRKLKLPNHLTQTAADSGGFVATFKWGDYRYSASQYVEWLSTFNPAWSATMDYCCEPEIAQNGGIVKERQERTSVMAHHFWKEYRDTQWTWTPTIQGWDVADYERHARELKPLIMEMKQHYEDNPAFRVGIGTLCKRASSYQIWQTVLTVASILPNVPLHLWGVKLGALKMQYSLPNVVSVDSAAWSGLFGGDIEISRDERKALGITRSKWCYEVQLPRYLAKFENAFNPRKQMRLF